MAAAFAYLRMPAVPTPRGSHRHASPCQIEWEYFQLESWCGREDSDFGVLRGPNSPVCNKGSLLPYLYQLVPEDARA
jgi:hypothetical protein